MQIEIARIDPSLPGRSKHNDNDNDDDDRNNDDKHKHTNTTTNNDGNSNNNSTNTNTNRIDKDHNTIKPILTMMIMTQIKQTPRALNKYK